MLVNYRDIGNGMKLSADCTHVLNEYDERLERDNATERLNVMGTHARDLMLYGPTVYGTHVAVPSSKTKIQRAFTVLAVRSRGGAVECVTM